MKIKLDRQSLTLGDLEDFEEVSGQSLDRVLSVAESDEASMASLSMRSVLSLIWIAGRKSDPDLTYEKVRQISLADLSDLEVEVVDDELDPTNGGA